MDILRTPDERFANLPDYPFAPHYFEVLPLRLPDSEGRRDSGGKRVTRSVDAQRRSRLVEGKGVGSRNMETVTRRDVIQANVLVH